MKGKTMSKATAKRISTGDYEYRGHRIARGWDGDWIIYRQCQGWEGNTILDAVDQLDTLAACKRMIDRWQDG